MRSDFLSFGVLGEYMRALFVLGAASFGIIGLTAVWLRKSRSLEHPQAFDSFGSSSEALDLLAETLRTNGGKSWTWTIDELDSNEGTLKARCVCARSTRDSIELFARLNDNKSSLYVTYQVDSATKLAVIPIVDRTNTAIAKAMDDLFTVWLEREQTAISELLEVLHGWREGERTLSREHLKALTSKLEKKAVEELEPGQRTRFGRFYVQKYKDGHARLYEVSGQTADLLDNRVENSDESVNYSEEAAHQSN